MENDLISRADAIDSIERTEWYHQAPDGTMVHGANSAEHQAWYKEQDVYKALENVPTAQRWIPCSERQPEKRSDWKNVTVIDESGDTSYIYTSVGFYLSDGCWIVDNEPMDDDSSIRVLAWMPLPEPYEPPKEET